MSRPCQQVCSLATNNFKCCFKYFSAKQLNVFQMCRRRFRRLTRCLELTHRLNLNLKFDFDFEFEIEFGFEF
jgi:hypothetical protein